jgi:hypothetical protein
MGSGVPDRRTSRSIAVAGRSLYGRTRRTLGLLGPFTSPRRRGTGEAGEDYSTSVKASTPIRTPKSAIVF